MQRGPWGLGFRVRSGYRSLTAHRILPHAHRLIRPVACAPAAGAWDSIKALAALGDGVGIGQWHPGV